MKKIVLILALAMSCVACNRSVIRCGNGIIVSPADGGQVRLEVINDDIIRVSAVPDGGRFSKEKSLCVIPQAKSAVYDVEDCDESIQLRTKSIIALADKKTGAVQFRDAEGNYIAGEDHREFSPVEADGARGYAVRQTFDAIDDESFFGLGQHQADEWDYKGRNEELYQYNTKISVPFIVSSRKYGILWDSYCFCRWGDPRDYAHLGDVFKLYDKDGVEGALTGTYKPLEGEPLIRRETSIAQEYLRTPQCDIVQNSPEGFNFNGSEVLFEGSIEPTESGLFHFYIYYAGYTKVFIGGKQVTPEIWRTAWNPNGRKFELDLEEGVRVPLRIEWKPDGGVSYCSLKVLSPVDPDEQGKMSWWGEMQDQIDYYFIAGGSIDEVISGYRTLTGKAQIMPEWAMGYWQSRERYRTQEEITGTLKEFRDRHIPVDNIVQDWQYWKDDQWGSHEFDETRFPDPAGMVRDIHDMNGRFMISVWPKFYEGTEHFDEMDKRGWIYRTAIDDKVIDWLGYSQSFYDAYDPEARKLFWEQMKEHLYPIGVDAWWMDASEPNIHDCTDMDYRKKMCGPTALGPSTKYFNAYALMNAQAIYEGQRQSDPDRRVFLLTRNGFAGLQRYSTASWSGDIGTRWEDMKAQISAGLNYSISGIPFWGQDIGGFSVESRFVAAQSLFDSTGTVNEDLKEWRELQARWHEWGVFCPLYRSHGQWPFREPWNIAPEGDPAYQAIIDCDKTRYRLLPYIYSMAARVHFDDYTIMRPLVMDFTDDAMARGISDQFMFGDALMICPVYEYGARTRQVYLPEGGWYDAYDNSFLQGGRTLVADAPFERIPIFCKAGSIVVKGPDVECTADKGDGSLAVMVYPGKDAAFTLYEDDGLTYGYEKGQFSRIAMKWAETDGALEISEREGRFEGMIAEREITVTVAGRGVECVRYDGKAVRLDF